jgi:hypothetical protein
LSGHRDSPARRAIERYFPEAPLLTPDDLGLVLRHGGRDVFLPAPQVVEIAPVLPYSLLPSAPGVGISFWRGRALEVRGIGGASVSFVLVRGKQRDYFLVSETFPTAVSRALAANVEPYAEEA